MIRGPAAPIISVMARSAQPTRYLLVPRATQAAEAGPPRARVRRYSLARLGPSPRSALGEDRHERMERAAGIWRG
jgi:hypothetical protein